MKEDNVIVKEQVIKASVVADPKSVAHYHGSVKIQTLKGDKVIRTQIFKNAGMADLFSGMVLSLANRVSEARNYFPRYINTFSIGTIGTDASALVKPWNQFIADNKTSLVNAYYNTTPNVSKVITSSTSDTLIDLANVTFKFMLPLTQITRPTQSDALGLFNNQGNLCAYIFLTNETNKLIGLTTEEGTNDYNFQIQWILTVTN